MNDSENEDFSYVSSVDPFTPAKDAPSADVADEKALVRLVRAMDSEIALYHTMSGMKRFDAKKFNADQREAMCDRYVESLLGLKQIMINAIDGIKGKQNG